MQARVVGASGRFLLALSLSLGTGCVSSPEVKQASSELTTIYASLAGAEGTFRRAFLTELARTQSDLEAAIVARAVKAKVDQLSAEEQQGNLIALSEEIEAEQRATRALLARVRREARRQAKGSPELTGEAFASAFQRTLIDERIAAAEDLEALGAVDEAADIRTNAANFSDAAGRQDIAAIFELMQTEAVVKRNLEDFQVVVRALQEMHATIDQWIMTDVNVSGSQIADLVERANEVLE